MDTNALRDWGFKQPSPQSASLEDNDAAAAVAAISNLPESGPSARARVFEVFLNLILLL